MTEARNDDQRRSHIPGPAQMPSVAEARHALAIHGQQNNFRTITIQFFDPADAEVFDKRVRGSGPHHAIERTIYTGVELEVVTEP